MEDRIAVSTPTVPPDAIKALMMLHADMIQSETRMSAAINEQVQSLRHEVGQFRRDLDVLVDRPEFCRHSVAALRVAPFKLYR